MTDQPRPVWLTDHDTDWLMAAVKHLRMDGHIHVADIVEAIAQRRQDAPADPTEAAYEAMVAEFFRDKGEAWKIHTLVAGVLRALGMP